MPSNFERVSETKFLAPSNVKLLFQGFTKITRMVNVRVILNLNTQYMTDETSTFCEADAIFRL